MIQTPAFVMIIVPKYHTIFVEVLVQIFKGKQCFKKEKRRAILCGFLPVYFASPLLCIILALYKCILNFKTREKFFSEKRSNSRFLR